MPVRYSRSAYLQQQQILRYLSNENRSVAAAFNWRLDELLLLLERQHGIGRRTRLPRVYAFRTDPFSYRLFYRSIPDRNELTILRFRHTSQAGNWREGS